MSFPDSCLVLESLPLPHLHTQGHPAYCGMQSWLGPCCLVAFPTKQSMSGHMSGSRLEVKDSGKERGLGLELWLV